MLRTLGVQIYRVSMDSCLFSRDYSTKSMRPDEMHLMMLRYVANGITKSSRRVDWVMSRGPFQTNRFSDFICFLVWSIKPEKLDSGIHKTWHLCKTFQLSTFCLCTIKCSRVTAGRERAGFKAFSCPTNFICASSPALVLYWEKGRNDNQFSRVELKLKLLPLAWTQTELGKDWCHHPHRGRRSTPLMGSSHAWALRASSCELPG